MRWSYGLALVMLLTGAPVLSQGNATPLEPMAQTRARSSRTPRLHGLQAPRRQPDRVLRAALRARVIAGAASSRTALGRFGNALRRAPLRVRAGAARSRTTLGRLGGALRRAPASAKTGLCRSGRWIKDNPKAAAAIGLGIGASVAVSALGAPELRDAMGGGVLGQVVGGGVSSAVRSVVVNGAMQRVIRGKIDKKELLADVSLSAVGGGYGFGAAHFLGLGSKALGLAGLAKGAYTFVCLAAIETVKDGYQIALRNVARRRAGKTTKPVFAGMRQCFGMEALTGVPRLGNPDSFGLKNMSDFVAASLYHVIVNPGGHKTGKADENGPAGDKRTNH